MKKPANNAPVRGGAELRALLLFAKELGFTCDTANSTKLVFRRPDTKVVFAGYTSPSRLNTKKKLQKAYNEAEKLKKERLRHE